MLRNRQEAIESLDFYPLLDLASYAGISNRTISTAPFSMFWKMQFSSLNLSGFNTLMPVPLQLIIELFSRVMIDLKPPSTP